ncbi:hypothetical protein PROFUN_03785 [Planoprotostelium fungivorum]|uniref:Uncharacterized protein n=1 Tax=Planoprotostelium fungivorum TaxID=1890364 RepID=A0A2P6NDT9_9EUKA|nr:hypothetical protein PROFUN_03785 [Planoprotostelium fungivorum]
MRLRTTHSLPQVPPIVETIRSVAYIGIRTSQTKRNNIPPPKPPYPFTVSMPHTHTNGRHWYKDIHNAWNLLVKRC